jgi:preprotein translocase subunit SecB
MNPPLQLKDHIYPKIVVVANENVPLKGSNNNEFGYNFNYEVRAFKAKAKDLEYQVELRIVALEADGKNKGYDIELVIAGLFDVEETVDIDKRDELVAVMGPTLLYGAAREFLYGLTKRGPYPAVYLPTISFIGDKIPEDQQKEPASTKKKPPKSKSVKNKSRNKMERNN